VQAFSEITIPVPVNSPSKDVNELNTAGNLQQFQEVWGDMYSEEIGPYDLLRAGLAYLPAQGDQTAAKLYFGLANHDVGGDDDTGPTHGWCELDLADPQTAGIWSVGGYKKYVTADYLFEIPQSWADDYVSGQYLATGRFRDGGQGAEGPSIFAIAPWDDGNPPDDGATVSATPLLLYQSFYETNPVSMTGYHHSDEWSGATWLTTSDKHAVIFVGTKGQGDCWYGCKDGSHDPDCPERGWWSTNFVGQMLFYDPADLAAVAAGTMAPHDPQPYATMNIDEYLYHITEDQQKGHLGAAAFDRQRDLLYVAEPFGDDDKPLIHVWQVE
jgi:hypothetical protein